VAVTSTAAPGTRCPRSVAKLPSGRSLPALEETRLPLDLPAKTRKAPKLKLRAAKDASIELREFGEWTLEKLVVLEKYLKQYVQVAGNGTYIDGFAGKGSLAITGHDAEYKGSARIAIDSGTFKEHYLFEKHATTYADLDTNLRYHYPQKRRNHIHLSDGDFNTEIVDLLASGKIPKEKPCFAFLDPNSTELPWTTVELLANYKEFRPPKDCKVELWILFNSHQAFQRLIDRQGIDDYEHSGRAKTFDKNMGCRYAWWDLFEAGAHINAYASRYADRLMDDLGYGFAHAQIIRDPGTGADQYFMIHASDHKAAFDFMRWAKKTSNYFDNTIPLPGLE
jgi:three-Cys-motif partner protein